MRGKKLLFVAATALGVATYLRRHNSKTPEQKFNFVTSEAQSRLVEIQYYAFRGQFDLLRFEEFDAYILCHANKLTKKDIGRIVSVGCSDRRIDDAVFALWVSVLPS